MCNTPYSKELIQLYKEFYLRIVKKTRQVPVNIFTTNYDLYSENALDELGIMYNNGFLGSAQRIFNPNSYNYVVVENLGLSRDVWKSFIIFLSLWIWEDIPMTAVQDILRSLGITRCYKGFKHTEYAICLAIQDESRLEAITKEIYMETAAHFECNWTAVERNIRTAVSRAWSVNPGLLCQMAGYPLESEPTSSQFIEIISSYTIRSQQLQAQLQPLGLP